MVNPNDPNSEPDGVSPSEPSSDPSSSESGPISDELFDSLSELLGDAPTTDEPATLPDIEAWSQESEPTVEPLSSFVEDAGEILEDPTFTQMPEQDTPVAEDLSAIEDNLSGRSATSELDDILAISSDEENELVPDPWADEPEVPSSPLPVEPGLSDDLTPDRSQEPSLPNIEAAASGEPSDMSADPWADPGSADPPSIESIAADLEDQTLIQAPDVQMPSEASADLPQAEIPLPDPWADEPEPSVPLEAADEERLSEPTTSTPNLSAPDLDIPEITAPIPEPDIDIPAIPEPAVDETPSANLPISEEESLPIVEETPIPVDTAFPIGEDSPLTPDVPAQSLDVQETEEGPIPPSPDITSADLEEMPAGDDSPLSPDAEPISESISPSEPEVTPIPDLPIPEPVTATSTAMSSSLSGSSSGDLGTLSNKLPFNRYQAVGLLVAFSTLGTVTYLGITGNSPDPSLPDPSPSSSTDASIPTNNQPSDTPLSNPNSDIAVIPPSAGEGTPSTNNPPGQAPTNPTAAAPQSPPEAIGGSETPEVIPSQLDISDVPEDHWAYSFITQLHAEGIIPDYPNGTFQPDKPVTRAELAAQIQRAFLDEPGQRSLTFSDIASDYWAADAIKGAVDKQFMSGYPEGDFRPDKLVPRYEVLVALVSGLELGIPASPETSLQRFPDQDQLPEWSKGKIAASTQENIVVNHPDPGLLQPAANATRAEVAAMIYQALVQSGRLDPIESEYVVTPDS